MQDFNMAASYVAALTNSDPNTAIIDVRMIHDTNKAVAAIPRRGALPHLWNEIVAWNNLGYGAFININEMDGNGLEIANVASIRCQAIDLDNINAHEDYERAITFNPRPSFAVQSSPGKFHVYWKTRSHRNTDGFGMLQRKLRVLFNGDRKIVDPTRVLRLPGTYHLKDSPHLITCWSLDGFGQELDTSILELALYNVNVTDTTGERKPLGDPSLTAPSVDWLLRALHYNDPNTMDRSEWIGFSSAFKQAGWNYFPEDQLYDMWSKWSKQYLVDGKYIPDEAYLRKNWNSFRDTQLGWPSLVYRTPTLRASNLYGEHGPAPFTPPEPQPQSLGAAVSPVVSLPPVQPPPPLGELLSEHEQKQFFSGCTFVQQFGEILIPDGSFLNQHKFNVKFGGKKFVIDSVGKITTEAWQAATRSTLWQIPQAHHIRFIPSRPNGDLIKDVRGRIGINTYYPLSIDMTPGDVTPFLNHFNAFFPNEIDRHILFQYLAHNVKFPGYKIPWAPLIQSAEGTGKNLLKYVMQHAIGDIYTYEPKAKELIESGSKFNAWMRARLFIIVDEIKTDEKRDMIEILKPMISEERIEVQAKGVDQELEDNFSNWIFFSNYKDAIPVDKNSRRFAILYSAIQSAEDIQRHGMTDQYFKDLYWWLNEMGGKQAIAHWLMNYPVDRGMVPMRAPITSSTAEAVRQSRGPVESIVADAIQDGIEGFRSGWVSSLAVAKRLKGTSVRAVSAKTLDGIMAGLGYFPVGRAPRTFYRESPEQRAELYNVDRNADVGLFGPMQGYA